MDFNDVLARLSIDSDFRRRARIDPAGALAGYRLSADEFAVVQSCLCRLDRPGPHATTPLAADTANQTARAWPAATDDLFDAMLA